MCFSGHVSIRDVQIDLFSVAFSWSNSYSFNRKRSEMMYDCLYYSPDRVYTTQVTKGPNQKSAPIISVYYIAII